MMISVEQAKAEAWDVIVAGTSFSAMYFVLGLPSDLRVLMIEKGGFEDHADQVFERRIPGREDFRLGDRHPDTKEWVAHTTFGGNSNCWTGNVPRFMPNDFQMKTLYGQGEDWPLSYDDLEPYYARVEAAMEVAGGGSEHLFPRSTPYPFPPHAPTRTDDLLRQHSDGWIPLPTARSNGGSRATCCATGLCHLCPIDAKYSILNDQDRFLRDGVAVVLNTEVRQVIVEGGKATGIIARSAGRDITFKAGHVALAANGVFNPAILLRSGIEHPALGRYLNEQYGAHRLVDAPGLGYFGGTSYTGLGFDLYDGPHRKDYAAALIEIINVPAQLRPEIGRWGERAFTKIIVEDLPLEHNRVYLDDDEPVLDWSGFSDYAIKGMKAATDALPDLFPDVEDYILLEDARSEAHIQGTHRMGNDPERFVTDGYQRMHSIPNIHVLGSGGFPTSVTANPTLTLAALALRAGEAMT
ncbi:GMC oxidoreductase [Actibacterium sp. 188UL27-1]|uniref:GMC oxidoreductase n=1 Tax=Actibacterium sp. 188UL27-1 TaxID=2786961 RepID=UPI00195E35FC|nr:GMC family oxidoreductase [Actibacterium sp. 188UL27-1]MBM7067692.1 GMC family oxidoreductase [Actibacterium sp. 188UL27-1]